LLALDIPTGSRIVTMFFTWIVTMFFAAHADPFLTVERRTSRPTGRARAPRPSIGSLVAYGRRRGKPRFYWSLAYSALASWSSGRSGSASFQAARKF
jgi:hypothetical protein